MRTQVLISTYWNVKTDAKDFAIKIKTVLISTYWNVKPFLYYIIFYKNRFNLNLLECKDIIQLLPTFCKRVLISTYWNVKLQIQIHYTSKLSVLISTYWNVKNEKSTGKDISSMF